LRRDPSAALADEGSWIPAGPRRVTGVAPPPRADGADLLGRVLAAQEAERARIARELHDDVSQRLAVMGMALSSLRRSLVDSAPDLAERVSSLQRHNAELARDVHALSHDLHPGWLRHAGLVAALRATCAEVQDLAGIEVTFRTNQEFVALPGDVSLCLYRVAQETLHNVVKHAGARSAVVSLGLSVGWLTMTVSDDGHGFSPEESRSQPGLGLLSVEERVRQVGGRLEIHSDAAHGTELKVTVAVVSLREPS
jgi:two-component system sensor histidine kinase UhpB